MALTKEMRQWLSDNRETYEFYLLHALLHDPLWRTRMISTPVIPDDFWREEYALVMGAVINAVEIHGAMNRTLPCPPSREFLRTYVESEARQEGSDHETVAGALKLVSELQDEKFVEMHYTISPYFEGWYGSRRAKRAAREFNKYEVPDVHGQLAEMQQALDAAASQVNGSLDDCEFDFDNEPEVPEPILMLGEYSLCTRGNISNIQGPPKAGKSAVIEAILAAAIRLSWLPVSGDTLGFEVQCQPSDAIIHIDTEQSEHDHHALVRRSYKRGFRKERVEQLHSYLLTGQEPETCWDFLLRKVDEAFRKHGGISLVILDGIADFCRDPNDGEACFDLIRKLHKVALDYDCTIITVLHENPGSTSGKGRGHLGSQMERKAETVLRLTKDVKTGVFKMWTERSRHCFIPMSAAMRFEWNDEAKMHLSLWGSDSPVETSKPDKDTKFAKEVEEIFQGHDEFTYTQLWKRVSEVVGISSSTAKQRVSEYLARALIVKEDRRYRRLPSQSASSV